MARVSLGGDSQEEKKNDVPDIPVSVRKEIARKAEVQTKPTVKPGFVVPWSGLDDSKPQKNFALRMTEKMASQVKFISENSEYSVNSFILASIREHVKLKMLEAKDRYNENLLD